MMLLMIDPCGHASFFCIIFFFFLCLCVSQRRFFFLCVCVMEEDKTMTRIDDVESLNAVAEEETHDIYASTKRRHSLTKDGLKALREATVEQIAESDKDVARAISLFFGNHVYDAEEIFARKAGVDPFHALGAACICTIKAMLSLTKSDMETAVERISFTITFAEELVPSDKNLFSKLADAFRRSSNKKRLLPGEFRAKAILADAYFFRGFILLLQQNSINGILRGGMALNRSYCLLKSLANELDELKEEKKASSYDEIGLDCNSVYNALLGCGCVNVVMSMLPPRILRVLNFFGFTHDRELGLARVSQCWESKTILAPLAGLFIVAVNSFPPGFCSLTKPVLLPVAKATASDAIKRPPTENSVLHLWLTGRISRIELNMDESIAIFSRCLELVDKGQIAKSMSQLRDFAVYDQAWNYALSMRWEDAIKNYAYLEESSAWSKIFYAYAQACGYEMLLQSTPEGNVSEALHYKEKATEAYWRAAHYNVTVMGGRTVVIESFVARRLHDIFRQASVPYPNPGNKSATVRPLTPPPSNVVLQNIVQLPMLELFVLFELMHQLSPSHLEAFATIIDGVLESKAPASLQTPKSDEESVDHIQPSTKKGRSLEKQQSVVLTTIKAIVLSHIPGKEEIALNLIQQSKKVACEYKGRSCTVAWMHCWLLYEEATMAFNSGDTKKTVELLSRAEDMNDDHIFRTAIETKLHFARWVVRDTTHKKKK
ncbi:hypothetical protein MOQ_002595 [Trypanosoma cruzi marinkellei]|uniref:Uncharacterized protein n=1 Tax=Trypanosoma cruzi marinkellei TaxID=85056 RepID=K2NXF3_TRYCR|nr:hypothetical protein MOQ_002595 [Trypanosoma cruzi marinkellei]